MAHYAIDKTLTIDELRFHYRDWDGHGWPVLLLHGLSSTAHIWDLVAPLLVEEARAVALDLRGHGRSDKPDGDYGFPTVGGDVRRVLAELQFDCPVIVGHSWGASIGLWLAATYPDEIGGLVMVDGGLIDLGSLSWDETLRRLTPPALNGTPVEEFRAMIVSQSPQGIVSPAVEAALLANFEIDAENRIHRRLPVEFHLRILRAMWEQRLPDLYRKVTCPVLILPARWKDRDDAEMLSHKEKGAAEAESLFADVEVVWVDESIHDMPLHHPHRLAEEIGRFIRERL